MTIFSCSLRYGDYLRRITIASFVSSKREIGSGAFLILLDIENGFILSTHNAAVRCRVVSQLSLRPFCRPPRWLMGASRTMVRRG